MIAVANVSELTAKPWVDVSEDCSKRSLASGIVLIVTKGPSGWRWTILDPSDVVLDQFDKSLGAWSEKALAQGDAERHAEKLACLELPLFTCPICKRVVEKRTASLLCATKEELVVWHLNMHTADFLARVCETLERLNDSGKLQPELLPFAANSKALRKAHNELFPD